MDVIAVFVLVVAVLALSSPKFMYRLGKGSEKPRRAPSVACRRPRPKPIRAPANTGPNAAWKAPEAGARIIEGRAYVMNGDSLIIQKVEVRLFGVDAPEMNHPFGTRAKWALFEMCKGHAIRAHVHHIDTYGRTVAKCYLPDGRDLSAEIVKQGLALDWLKFSEGAYREFETADARRKLWLADARQKGRMHVWEKFEAQKKG